VPEGVRIGAKIRLAEIQFRKGDSDTPWATLRKLVEEHPDVINLQRSVGQLAFARNDYAQAVESYSVLLKNLPERTSPEARAELLFARGAAYERDGKVKEATVDLQAALKLVPTSAQIMNYLGYMWVDSGVNVDEAFQLLQKAHLLAPQDGAITDSLGWAYYKQGDYATAMTYLVAATEQEPESPEIYDHLGDAYAKLGRKLDAEREWQRALDLANAGHEVPGKDFVKNVKKKLR
jgi:Flp pilus assembly protein TadD